MDNKTASNSQKMFVKFFLKHGSIVDWQVPDPANFSFPVMCLNVCATGFFSAPDLYIPADEIAVIGFGNAQVKMPQPVHPAPAARQ